MNGCSRKKKRHKQKPVICTIKICEESETALHKFVVVCHGGQVGVSDAERDVSSEM